MSAQDDLKNKLAANHAADDAQASSSGAQALSTVNLQRSSTVVEQFRVETPSFYNSSVYVSRGNKGLFEYFHKSGNGATDPAYTSIFTHNTVAITMSRDCGCIFAITNDGAADYIEIVDLNSKSLVGTPVAISGIPGNIQDVVYSTRLNKYLVLTDDSGPSMYSLDESGTGSFSGSLNIEPHLSNSFSLTSAPTGELYFGFQASSGTSKILELFSPDFETIYFNFREVLAIGGGEYFTAYMGYTFENLIVAGAGNTTDSVTLDINGNILFSKNGEGPAPQTSIAAKPLMNDWYLYKDAPVTKVSQYSKDGQLLDSKFYNLIGVDVTSVMNPNYLKIA